MKAWTQRDAVITRILARMDTDPLLFFLTADLGAPALDEMRARHPDRCVNVGIAEQNLVTLATGIALEGGRVFGYGIAPFVSMRAFEQIRTSVSLLSHTRSLDLVLLSLGAGFSYDMSGPSHQCTEDIPLLRMLPRVGLWSPCDSVTAGAMVDRALEVGGPRYMRLEGKALPPVYDTPDKIDFNLGFSRLRVGSGVCLVTTGYPTHMALALADRLAATGVALGVVDLFDLKTPDLDALARELEGYRHIFTVEEGFVRCGGMDSLVADLLLDRGIPARLRRYGPQGRYHLENGDRAGLHRQFGMDLDTLERDVHVCLGG